MKWYENRNILGPAQTLGFFRPVLVNQTLAHNKWIGVIWGLRKPWFTVAKYNHHDFTRRPLSWIIDPLKTSIWTQPKKYVFQNRDFMGFLVKSNDSQLMSNQPTPPLRNALRHKGFIASLIKGNTMVDQSWSLTLVFAGVCPSAVWEKQSLIHLVLRTKGGMVLFVDNVSPLYINPYRLERALLAGISRNIRLTDDRSRSQSVLSSDVPCSVWTCFRRATTGCCMLRGPRGEIFDNNTQINKYCDRSLVSWVLTGHGWAIRCPGHGSWLSKESSELVVYWTAFGIIHKARRRLCIPTWTSMVCFGELCLQITTCAISDWTYKFGWCLNLCPTVTPGMDWALPVRRVDCFSHHSSNWWFGTDRYASGLTLEQQCEAEVLFRIWRGGLCISGFSWPAFDMGVRCFELDLFPPFLLYMNPWIKLDTLYQDCFVYWRSNFIFKKKGANSASTREDYPQCCLRWCMDKTFALIYPIAL